MEREISAGEAILLWLRARPILPDPSLLWPFKHTGLSSEDVDPWWSSRRDPHQMETNRVGMENLCASQSSDVYKENLQINEWIACPVFCHPYSQTFLHGGGFTRHSSTEGWAWIMAHHRSGLCSLMFIACGLKCRKSLWECQWSRKEKTSLVLQPSYIFSIWNSCVLSPVLFEATKLLGLNMKKLPPRKKNPGSSSSRRLCD